MPISLDTNLYTKVFEKLDSALTSYVTDTSVSIVNSIAPAVGVLLSVYVILWGWSMLRGVINEPVLDGVTRIIRLSIIAGLALSTGYYANYVSDWVWETPDVLARVISGQENLESVVFLDSLLGHFFSLGNNFMLAAEQDSTLGLPDLTLFFSAVCILLAGVLLTAYSAFLFILGKIFLAILLSVGPIFISLAIFEATRKFLEAWIGQILNYVFLIMLTAASVKLILTLIEHYFRATQVSEPNIGDALQLIAISTIGFLALIQMPSVASALSGGVALSTLSGFSWAYSKAKAIVGQSRNVLTGEKLADYRATQKRKAELARWAARNR